MNELDFAINKGFNIGDRLVRNKGIVSRHHGIYAGVYNGLPWVAECQVAAGVQYVQLSSFLRGNANNLVRVEPFTGTEQARAQIIPQINSLLGTQYDLVKFNCEHFAELIQSGAAESKQVKVAVGLGIIAVLGIIAMAHD